MLEGDHVLDLVKLSADPGIVLIAVGVEFSKSAEACFWFPMVDEPTEKSQLVMRE